MKNQIKSLLNIIFLLLIVLLFFTSGLTGLKIILAIVLFGLIISHNQLIRFVEREVVRVYDERLPSYKVRVWVIPDWYEILKHLSPNLKDVGEINKFVEEQNKKSSKSKDSLIHNNFGFVDFYDGVSSLRQIWSEKYKTFVDKMEVRGYIFDYDEWVNEYNKYRKKGGKYNITDTLVIHPEFIGFHTVLPDGSVLEDCILATIPYSDTISFLIDQGKKIVIGGGMLAVKTFPKDLNDRLEKCGVKYSIDNYNHEDYGTGVEFKKDEVIKGENGAEFYHQRMKHHSFKTKYYSLDIEIEIF